MEKCRRISCAAGKSTHILAIPAAPAVRHSLLPLLSFPLAPAVIPAKAGIQHTTRHSRESGNPENCSDAMDPRFREDDE